MSTFGLQRLPTYFSTGMWSSPRINFRVDFLPTKTEILLGKLFFSILTSTFWAEMEKNYVLKD
jgi:hypothetical protein